MLLPVIDESSAEFFRLQQALAGRYSIERELGRGGMGIVYLAREVSLDRPVALKLLPPALATRPHLRERFLSEARTAAKLSHPNIVPIYAVDEVDEFVFFAMAFVDGETLGERIRRQGPRPPSEVARILREVAWALGYAHGQGVVHRDVKPDNILLESDSGRALVADFGIASLAEEVGARDPARVSGTAEFMSPEQARGEPASGASDIYSLGVVGYYALSGRFPFEAPTPASLLAKHIAEPPPPLARMTKDVPGKLARAIDRCLAKEPVQRFASDAELAAAIGQLLDEHRDLPVAVRVFVKRSSRFGGASTLLYLWLLTMVAGVVASGFPPELAFSAGLGVFISGVTVVPLAILTRRAHRLIESGYGRDDVVAALKGEVERAREEGAFEFGHGPSRYERVVRYIAAGGLGVGIFSSVAIAFFPGAPPDALAMITGTSLTVGGGAAVLAALRLQRRRDLDSELWYRFWRSRLGSWVFRLASLGRKRVPSAASATHRPTEQAIGLAADRLFDELPRPMRRALSDLPEVVRKLQADAQNMRGRLEELDAVIAKMGSERTSRALAESPSARARSSVAEERRRLDHDLHAARDATQQRLAEAVAALETIRLGLLRMQAGAGSVESLTGDLAAAREVADDIGRLLQGQREVESLLKGERKEPKP